MVWFLYIFKKMSNSLIPSFIIRDVREWLRLLNKNESCEHITQVTHKKWANRSFFWVNHCWQKTSNSLRKPKREFPTLVCIIRRSQALWCASYWLHAVLACAESDSWKVLANFGFANISMSDSAQCYLAQSPTPLSVSLREVRLRAG